MENRNVEDASKFDAAFLRLLECVEAACGRQADWPNRVAAAIVASLDLSAAEPATMRALTSDVFDDGLAGALRYRRAVAHFATLLAEGRLHPGASALPATTEEALIGAVASPISEAVRIGRGASLPSLGPELIEFVLAPYLGAAEARRIGERYTGVAAEAAA